MDESVSLMILYPYRYKIRYTYTPWDIFDVEL